VRGQGAHSVARRLLMRMHGGQRTAHPTLQWCLPTSSRPAKISPERGLCAKHQPQQSDTACALNYYLSKSCSSARMSSHRRKRSERRMNDSSFSLASVPVCHHSVAAMPRCALALNSVARRPVNNFPEVFPKKWRLFQNLVLLANFGGRFERISGGSVRETSLI